MCASVSGKSTLLYLLGGLEKPDGGDITIGQTSIHHLNDENLSNFRNKMIGFVFQFHYLLNSMSVLENLYLPSRIGGGLSKETKDWIYDLCNHLGLAKLVKKMPYQLSGGEQQRVNLVRAISTRPKILFCDEPTGNLDSENSSLVVDLIVKLTNQEKMTTLCVTHNYEVADHFSHKWFMKDGRLVQKSTFCGA